MNRPLILLAICLSLAACGKAGQEAASAPPTDVELALIVSRAIEANIAATDSVLTAHGLTRASFDSLLFRIAADPTMSAAYAAGRR
ncbi:MAG: hypothetical protein WD771_08360 [Gemmatimonadaceae bacterium]